MALNGLPHLPSTREAFQLEYKWTLSKTPRMVQELRFGVLSLMARSFQHRFSRISLADEASCSFWAVCHCYSPMSFSPITMEGNTKCWSCMVVWAMLICENLSWENWRCFILTKFSCNTEAIVFWNSLLMHLYHSVNKKTSEKSNF